MFPRSFSSRIFIALTALVALLLSLAAWFVEVRVAAFQESEVERRLGAVASLLGDETRAVLEGRLDPKTAQQTFLEHARSTELRLTIIAKDGEVLADSSRPPPIASHADRVEFISAMRDGTGSEKRSSTTTSEPTFYFARRIDGPNGALGAIRVAASLESIDSEIAFLEMSFLFGGLLVVIAGLVGAFIVSRRLARPLESIVQLASEVAAGGNHTSIRIAGPHEVQRLGEAINAMADELRQRLVSIERARAETESILESLKEGVIAVSDQERLLRMNGAAARLLGLVDPLASGAQLWRAVRFPELETALRRVIEGSAESLSLDSHSPTDDGTILSLTVTPLTTEGGRGAVAILSDVTGIRRLEKMRSDFVANVSHEMRTPLAVIMGALETLQDPTLGESDQRRFLEIAQLNAERMKSIVEDLLELSKIEAEGAAMTLEPLDIEGPVRAAANALELPARNKQILLSVEDPPERPLIVHGNFKRLEQVFTNLIENAIKYTPEGGAIHVRMQNGEREIGIEIEDTGIGIPPHALPRVFERFYRVDKGRSREMGGTGLGLAIVKHAVRAHGGRVSVRSEEGHGTTFIVAIPKIGVSTPSALVPEVAE